MINILLNAITQIHEDGYAQTTRAYNVDENMTIRELVDNLLMRFGKYQYDEYIEIRVCEDRGSFKLPPSGLNKKDALKST